MLGNVDKGDVGAFVLSLLSEREGVVKERRFWCNCLMLVLVIVLDVGAFVFSPLSDKEDVVKKYEHHYHHPHYQFYLSQRISW